MSRRHHVRRCRAELSKEHPDWQDDMRALLSLDGKPLNSIRWKVWAGDRHPIWVTIWMRGGFEGERLSPEDALELAEWEASREEI